MTWARGIIVAAGVLAIVAALSGASIVVFGLYNVAATHPHSQPAYWLMQTTAKRSIQRRAKDIPVPDLSDAAMIERGFQLFRQHCVACHGAPGIAPDAFAMGFEPGPPPLPETAREWTTQEVYWAIRHGIKMTAMPAWEFRLPDGDLWALVAFLKVLPNISPADYRRRLEQSPSASPALPFEAHGADAERGKLALHQYACNTCHEIPGISGPRVRTGPPLAGMATRLYIAGVLSNTPENMLRWIVHPQQVKPLTAMPDMGVAEAHARDMAAYIATLR